MKLAFTPSPDVIAVLNALLDKFEQRARRNLRALAGDAGAPGHSPRPIRADLSNLCLPAYFSQTDPAPRLVANEQLSQLEKADVVQLAWLPGETGHLLQTVTLQPHHALLYTLLGREPVAEARSRLEATLLADRFRFTQDDWRQRAIRRTLNQLRSGKSPAPFSLTDASWNPDLLAALSALDTLETETPYRVFSVRAFNDSKRFDELRSALTRLARYANPEWKTFTAEDILGELNLVANPTYIYLAGNWQLTTQTGEILLLGGFAPSVGFPAAQAETIVAASVHAESVLCIENLTAFHEFTRGQAPRNASYALICLMGNPSPAVRRLLGLVPETVPVRLWSDMDYGGFNILSQLRRRVRRQVQPYCMDIPTFEAHSHLSRPLTQAAARRLKRICACPELADVQPVLKHLIHRGLKLEQEAIRESTPS